MPDAFYSCLWRIDDTVHLVLAVLVAAHFADPIVSLQPYQFARHTADRSNRDTGKMRMTAEALTGKNVR